MKIESASEVRKRFQEIVDHVHYTKVPVIVSKNSKPWVIVQPLPENDTQMQQLIDTNKK